MSVTITMDEGEYEAIAEILLESYALPILIEEYVISTGIECELDFVKLRNYAKNIYYRTIDEFIEDEVDPEDEDYLQAVEENRVEDWISKNFDHTVYGDYVIEY